MLMLRGGVGGTGRYGREAISKFNLAVRQCGRSLTTYIFPTRANLNYIRVACLGAVLRHVDSAYCESKGGYGFKSTPIGKSNLHSTSSDLQVGGVQITVPNYLNPVQPTPRAARIVECHSPCHTRTIHSRE